MYGWLYLLWCRQVWTDIFLELLLDFPTSGITTVVRLGGGGEMDYGIGLIIDVRTYTWQKIVGFQVWVVKYYID
jgi:hypothetical protein